MQRIRCAIYTRKSSEDGLEQEFNSLDAQREACAAYITSQKAEGWEMLPDHYDDGGISGGTMDRPALQKLLSDVDEGKVDRIVVYKIDRLTRSLADFAKIVDRLDAAKASFVSVTQSFNTATSMGRLTLNMLLSFAQFEREVTAERIRDKLAASKRKGLWMGGNVPLGYQSSGRTLIIDSDEAEIIIKLYDLYAEHRTIWKVRDRANKLGLKSRTRTKPDGTSTGGKTLDRGHIHHILTNPIYAGRIRHKDKVYEGQHEAIIEPEHWEAIQKMLTEASAKTRGSKSAAFPSPLIGKVFDETGDRLTPSHSRKNGKRLRYYISHRLVTDKSKKHPEAWRLPAPQLEQAVVQSIRTKFADAAFITKAIRDIQASEIEVFSAKVANCNSGSSKAKLKVLELVEQATVAPGNLTSTISAVKLAEHLGIDVKRLDPEHLLISTTFRIRRKGVENRIILGDAPPEIDHVLISNIVRARNWYVDICKGTSFADIAKRDGTSPRRIQALIDLAFLSPATLKQIVLGTQPIGLTTEYLVRSGFPANWKEQEILFATLG